MIAFLKGVIEELKPNHVILDVNGVGYKAHISVQTYESLTKHDSQVKLITYQHITESDQRLFGFYHQNELDLFEKLITVKGVGPKLGLTILSGLSADEIIHSIGTANVALLSKIPGIGKKSAERIILELKDKMIGLGADADTHRVSEGIGIKEEAVSALISLGYKSKDAETAVNHAVSEGASDVSAIIKSALSSLNR